MLRFKTKYSPACEKREELVNNDLKNIKRKLAADKQVHGLYDDSQGIRYISTSLYIQIRDYVGGLKYVEWFEKNFPDDALAGIPF